MIEKLDMDEREYGSTHSHGGDNVSTTEVGKVTYRRIPGSAEISEKLNEVIERVNQLDALSGIDREIRGTTV